MNSHITVGLGEEGRVSSKVSRPPGGASSIFADEPTEVASPSRQGKPYRMASSFELGDEQPSNPMQQNRRRSKPSVNPLTGEIVGNFGPSSSPMVPPGHHSSNSPLTSSASSICSDEISSSSKEGTPSPPPSVISGDRTPPPRKGRIPPGGYSSPLW